MKRKGIRKIFNNTPKKMIMESVLLLLLGFLLMFCGIFYGKKYGNKLSDISDDGLIILILGDGYAHMDQIMIDVTFDDFGKIDLSFSSDDKEKTGL